VYGVNYVFVRDPLRIHILTFGKIYIAQRAIHGFEMKQIDKKQKEILTLTDSDKLPDDIFTKIVYDALWSAISGVAIMGLDGSIKWINPSFMKMFGVSEESQLIGRQLSGLFTSHHIHEIEDIIKSIDNKEKQTAEFEIKNDEGQTGYIELYYSDIRNYTGEIVGKMVSIHDVTPRKLLEKHLRLTSAKLVDAQETERERIARELHDSIGASLASLKFAVEERFSTLEREAGVSLQEPIVKRIQHLIDEVHAISKNLHPSILHDLGFNTAVRAFCRETRESFPGITIHSSVDISDADIPEKLKIVLYRVIQEGVTNAARHAAPDSIHVRLKKTRNAISLTIQDNGRGFDPKTLHNELLPGKGMGLKNIQDRAEIYEGTFDLDTAIGRGTVLKFTWPLQAIS
jgi:PAS domain S-box-containing protein